MKSYTWLLVLRETVMFSRESRCFTTVPRFLFVAAFLLKPGFHMSGKSQTSGLLLFPDRLRFYRLMKTRNRRYPRSSGMNGDQSGESGAFLFSRRVPDFCDGQRSFPTNENSNLYLRGRRRPPAMDFAHYQSPKFLNSSPPITNNRENFRQTSGKYPICRQNLGWSAKSKIPDRLGFSRHMKTLT